MRKIREMFRLKFETKLSIRQIADSIGVGGSTVAEYLTCGKNLGLSWPLPADLDDQALQQLLVPRRGRSSVQRPTPDWHVVDRELRRKGVTLWLLWQEYKAIHADGYHYSHFCYLYHHWHGKIDLVMRQTHKAGEKLFVDYAGHTIGVVDTSTGEVRQAQIFVAVLGASNYTYVEATFSQDLPAWIGSHQRAFAFFGGVPQIVVPDNLKSGVQKAHRYEPDLNRTYADMAEHYGVAVIPARPRKPRDKAKVESGVLLVERWILARLRDRMFFSLAALNQAIAELLVRLNDHPFQKLPGSRRSTFMEIERAALKPLPEHPYIFATWKKACVNVDYHIEVDRHRYSVPYAHVHQQLDVRITETTIECFAGQQRIAAHARNLTKGGYTTLSEHMPHPHQQYTEWTPERITRWASTIGPQTAELCERIIASRAHPQQGYRSCLGILRLANVHGPERLEAASRRALRIGARSYKSIESILKHRLDQQELPMQEGDQAVGDAPIEHTNIRGANYYTANGETHEC